MTGDETRAAIDELRCAGAVRERCGRIFAAGCEGELAHFRIRLDRLESVVDVVLAATDEAYPDGKIPPHSRWRHFSAGGNDRMGELEREWMSCSPFEKARSSVDLVVISVLLDAGAGGQWKYRDGSGQEFTRSEGLAVASWNLFREGFFSSDLDHPWRVDAAALRNITPEALARGFQVSKENPLVGESGRLHLLRELGRTMEEKPEFAGGDSDPPRIGNLLRGLEADQGAGSREVEASRLLGLVLRSLGPIWPGRFALKGMNLGDVWRHRLAGGSGETEGYVPFHKLSQWLTYSLMEPLLDLGWSVQGLSELTGLAEYRNGGLFLDAGVLETVDPEAGVVEHEPGSELVVEWRALTVILLDRLAERMRERLGKSEDELSLPQVLEGGSWRAGRKMAFARRSSGEPPLRIVSDGTVF